MVTGGNRRHRLKRQQDAGDVMFWSEIIDSEFVPSSRSEMDKTKLASHIRLFDL